MVMWLPAFISYSFHRLSSGTEKQHVANDYAKRLHIGQVECTTLIQEVVGGYMASKNGGAIPSLQYCEYLNISVCPASEAADSVSHVACPSSLSHYIVAIVAIYM